MNKKLIWIPRILGCLYIALLLLLSFDSENIIGFLIHSIPTAIFTTITIYSWNNKKYSWIIWSILAIITIIFFKTYKEIISFLIVSAPPLAIAGILYRIKLK